MNLETEVKKHAKFSASSSDRWLGCPGSISLIEKAPKPRDSKYAAEGTEAHECVEYLLKSLGRVARAADQLKKKYPEEMVNHAIEAAREIESRLVQAEGGELLCETKVSLEFIAPEMFGTVDAAIVEHFGRLTVVDYKYGAGIPIDPEENSQLIYYALGLAHLYDYNFSEVAIVIIQPRAEHERGPVREWITTIEKLQEWAEKFRAGVKAATEDDAPTVSGDHCRFCPAAVICPELSDKALSTAQVDFAPEKTAMAFPQVSAISNLGLVLTACEMLETWIGSVRSHAHDVLSRGGKVKGYKLVEKRSTRKWVNAVKVGKIAEMTFGEEAFTKPELLSPAQLEKAIPKAKAFVEKHASAVSSGTTIAPEDDKRPAVNLIEQDFGAVEPETGKGEEMGTKKKPGKKKPVKTEVKKPKKK